SLPRGEAVALVVDATGPAPVVAGLGLLPGTPNQSGPSDDAANSTRDARAGRLTWVGGTALLAAAPAAGAPARDADRPPVPFVDVPPIPAGAAGSLLLTAPWGPATEIGPVGGGAGGGRASPGRGPSAGPVRRRPAHPGGRRWLAVADRAMGAGN